jgi:hypothetical protein
MGLARGQIGSLLIIACRPHRDQVIRSSRSPGTGSGDRRRQQQGGDQTGQGLESSNDSGRGGRGENTRFIDAMIPGSRVSPSTMLKRVGQHGLGTAACARIVLLPVENWWLDWEMSIKEVFVPGVTGWT